MEWNENLGKKKIPGTEWNENLERKKNHFRSDPCLILFNSKIFETGHGMKIIEPGVATALSP
jgi:hypothetical protein